MAWMVSVSWLPRLASRVMVVLSVGCMGFGVFGRYCFVAVPARMGLGFWKDTISEKPQRRSDTACQTVRGNRLSEEVRGAVMALCAQLSRNDAFFLRIPQPPLNRFRTVKTCGFQILNGLPPPNAHKKHILASGFHFDPSPSTARNRVRPPHPSPRHLLFIR